MSAVALLAKLLRLMMSQSLHARRDVVLGAVGEAFGIALGVIGPYCLKILIDALSGGETSLSGLLVLVALFVLSWSGTSVTAALKLVYTTRIIDALARNLVVRAMRSQLPVIATERGGDTGRVLGLLERLPFSLQIVVDGLLWRAAPLLVQVAICLVVVSALAPVRYVMIMALVLAGYFLVTHLSGGRYREQARRTNLAAAAVSQALGDVLRNARRVIFNGNLAGEVDLVAERAEDKRRVADRLSWLLVRTAVLQYGVVGGGLITLLTLGALDVQAGRLTVGDFMLLQAYAFRLALPIGSFGFVLRQAGVSMINIQEVLSLIQTDEIGSKAQEAGDGAAAIRLRHVTFDYGPDLPGVRDIDLTITPGSFVVIVGPNGSGKSTLAQLMAGLLQPKAGVVLINDHEINAVDQAVRHRHVLYVPQFVGLFNRSLRANALYPPSRQSEPELGALLEDWRFYENGRIVDFDLMVGEQGERLSGGQIQKLELARLAGVEVPAVILDETTSALDVRSEGRAIGALRAAYSGGTTLILITHRMRLVPDADQVLFLRGGRMVAAGRHDVLIQTCADYRDLWALEADNLATPSRS